MPASRLTRATLDGIGDEDTRWTGPLVARIGNVYVRVTGTFGYFVTLQRSHDDGQTWTTVRPVYPGGAPMHVENAVSGAWYRLGFTEADDYESGEAEAELAQ